MKIFAFLIGVIKVNVIIDEIRFKYTILIFVFYLSHLFFVFSSPHFLPSSK